MKNYREETVKNITGISLYLPLATAFLARVAIFPLAHLRTPQLWEYGTFARNMLSGIGYAWTWYFNGVNYTFPSAFMPPGEGMVHYFGLRIFGDNIHGYTAIFLAHALFGTAFVYLAGLLTNKLFRNKRVTLTALWIAALNPSFVIANSSFGLLESALMLNMLVITLAVTLGERMRSSVGVKKYAALLGFACGVLCMFRSEAYLIVIATMLFVLYNNSNLRRAAGIALIALGCMAITISPWTVRNWMQFHRFIPGSTNGPFNLWRGNNEAASGSGWQGNGESVWPDVNLALNSIGKPADINIESNLSAYFTNETVKWITTHPVQAALTDLKKPVLLWLIDWYNTSSRNPLYIILTLTSFACFIAGLYRMRKDKMQLSTATYWEGTRVIGGWLIYYTLIIIAFFSAPRWQIMLVGIYVPVLAYGVENIFEKILFPLLPKKKS